MVIMQKLIAIWLVNGNGYYLIKTLKWMNITAIESRNTKKQNQQTNLLMDISYAWFSISGFFLKMYSRNATTFFLISLRSPLTSSDSKIDEPLSIAVFCCSDLQTLLPYGLQLVEHNPTTIWYNFDQRSFNLYNYGKVQFKNYLCIIAWV